MALKIPLGHSDFQEIREGGYTYVDKSLFIRDCIDDAAEVILLTRPRRFGKTSNLSMLRRYFEKTAASHWHLFADLAIARAGDGYRAHFGRYPTIALTFKDIRHDTFADCVLAMADLLSHAYGAHDYLLADAVLRPTEVARFTAILEGRADLALLGDALRLLTVLLHRHHGERVLILLDEYDLPLHQAYLKGYYDPAVGFFRNLLSGAFKDNSSLFKGVLTGILRTAKDSIFTGLNNLDVYTVLRPEYARHFGFTQAEVEGLLAMGDASAHLDEVQRWYNGYLFGGLVIYNPWSVLCFLKDQRKQPAPYWAETSSNELIRELLLDHGLGLVPEMEGLLRGETIECRLVEGVALRELREQPSLLWSFLLMSGYLKLVGQERRDRTLWGRVTIPNEEVLYIYETLFQAWTEAALGGEGQRGELLRALLRGDERLCQRHLESWLRRSASYFDVAAHDPPERFYHGFLLGVLVGLGSRYEVVSNRESGYGRCDVLITPTAAGQPGVVLELKVREEGETLEHALVAALRQIDERDYEQALRSRGAQPVHRMAFVFDGKRVLAGRGPAVGEGGTTG